MGNFTFLFLWTAMAPFLCQRSSFVIRDNSSSLWLQTTLTHDALSSRNSKVWGCRVSCVWGCCEQPQAKHCLFPITLKPMENHPLHPKTAATQGSMWCCCRHREVRLGNGRRGGDWSWVWGREERCFSKCLSSPATQQQLAVILHNAHYGNFLGKTQMDCPKQRILMPHSRNTPHMTRSRRWDQPSQHAWFGLIPSSQHHNSSSEPSRVLHHPSTGDVLSDQQSKSEES